MRHIPILIVFFSLLSCDLISQEKQEYMTIYQIFNQGEIEESAHLLSKFVEKYPKNYKGWTFYGVVETQLLNDSIAEIAFKKALSIKPDIKQALTGLGVIYRSQGKFDRAEELYLKSLEIDPDFSEAYSSLILIELHKKNFKKAVEYGERAVDIDYSNGVIAANLAVAYHFNSNFDLRDEMFQKAITLGYDKHGIEIIQKVFIGGITLEDLLKNE